MDNSSPKERNSGNLLERKASADAISDGQILLGEGETVLVSGAVELCDVPQFLSENQSLSWKLPPCVIGVSTRYTMIKYVTCLKNNHIYRYIRMYIDLFKRNAITRN